MLVPAAIFVFGFKHRRPMGLTEVMDATADDPRIRAVLDGVGRAFLYVIVAVFTGNALFAFGPK